MQSVTATLHFLQVSKQKHTVLSSELPTIHTTAAQAHFGRAAAAPAATLSSAIPVCVLPAMSKHTLSVPSVPLGKATASQHQSVETTSSHTNAVHAMPHTIAATASTPPMPVLNESHLNTPNPQQARGASKGPQPNQLGQTLCNGTSTKPRISAPDSKPAGHSATQPYFHPPTVKTRLAHAAGDSSSPKTSAIVASVSSPKASGSLDGLAVPMASSEMGSPSGSSRGRGRSFGRNRRGRGRPHISRPGDQALAGDL